MNQKKNKKIVLILIIVVAFILVVSAGILTYLTTDIFRSNKELFFKYTTQIGDKEKGFIEKDTKEYFEKKKTKPYTNEGDFSVNATTTEQKNLDNLNKFKVEFNGKIDNTNSNVEENVTLDYADNIKFPINYKRVGDKVGLQTQYVGSKYIAVETNAVNNISGEAVEPIKKIGDEALKIQEFAQINFSDAEKEQIKNTYFGVLNNQLKEELFSKINDANGDGYKLTLTGDDLKNIAIKLLETLREDQTTLNKINEYIKLQKNSSKITNSDITQKVEEIKQGKLLNDEKIEITVYKKSGKTSKISILMNEAKIDIQKLLNKDETKYVCEIELSNNNENLKINLVANYVKEKDNTISEKYELGLETAQNTYNYDLYNRVYFLDEMSMEDFTEENCMLLTKMPNEQVNTFLNSVKERLTEVNKQQMEKLGAVNGENPIKYLKPSLGTYSEMLKNMNKSKISQEDVVKFNKKFELYESTNLKGVTVKGLLSTILLNNEKDENIKIKEINFDGKEYEATNENIELIKENIQPETSYRVEFEKDQNTGIIYRTIISIK